jgi:hypothetical protein
MMPNHSHNFVETYDGLVGFGLNRETDESTIIYYLQKFSDDRLMTHIIKKLSDNELEEIFNMVSRLLKKYFSEPEYHRHFLKDDRIPAKK